MTNNLPEPDEIVLENVKMFHLESMNERALWIGCYTQDGKIYHLNISGDQLKYYWSEETDYENEQLLNSLQGTMATIDPYSVKKEAIDEYLIDTIEERLTRIEDKVDLLITQLKDVQEVVLAHEYVRNIGL